MPLVDAFDGPGWERLALALVHFLWQGLFVAAALAALLRVLRFAKAEVRYVLCFAVLCATAEWEDPTWRS